MGNASPVWSSIPNSLWLFAAAPGLDISAWFYETTPARRHGFNAAAEPAAYKDAAISAPGLDISNISNISCGLDESTYEAPGLLERFFWNRVMRELLQHHSETSVAATSAEDCLRTAFGFETPISASSAARFLRNVQSVCESDFAEPVCESDDDVASNISWNSCGHDIESTVNE